jgi:hypothetical protein
VPYAPDNHHVSGEVAFPGCSGHLTAEGDGAAKEYHNICLVNAVFAVQEVTPKLGQVTDAKEAGEGVGGFCQASQVGVAALQTVGF